MHWVDPSWLCLPAGRGHARRSVLPLCGSPTCPNTWKGKMLSFLPCNNALSKTVLMYLARSKLLYSLLGITLSEKMRFTCFSFSEETQICFQVWLTFFLNRHSAVQLENIDCTEQRESYIIAGGLHHSSIAIFTFFFFFSPRENFLLQPFLYF